MSSASRASMGPATPGSSAVPRPYKEHNLPPPSTSFWVDSTKDDKLPESPDAMRDVDVLGGGVLVLGGGIFGVTTAYLCKQAGLKVGIVEAADNICGDRSVTGALPADRV